VRAGIGCREGSRGVIRKNQCFANRRAGIGIRMAGTSPVVEDNRCYENAMAGIGCRDGAGPVIRGNECHRNNLAGIGCDGGAQVVIVDNECRQNDQAGIGIKGRGQATIQGNKCVGNKTVAIGVIGATAAILDNLLQSAEGQPPLVAIKESSLATLQGNRLTGGGVAAVLVHTSAATISSNRFLGAGEKQGNAVWVQDHSRVTIAENVFAGYRSAVDAAKATVLIRGNVIGKFRGTAIVVKASQQPAYVFGNTATSSDPQDKVVDVQGLQALVSENVLNPE
jgi:parallel beta-helix repeat protein